jgi:hypothetical protein
MHHFQGEIGGRKSIAPSRKLWTALHALDGYLTGQSDWMVSYAERCRITGWDCGHRGEGQFPGELPDEQLQQRRDWSFTSGSQRSPQWHARYRFRTETPARQSPPPASGVCRLIPKLAAVPAVSGRDASPPLSQSSRRSLGHTRAPAIGEPAGRSTARPRRRRSATDWP